MRLWLDDIRAAPAGYVHAHSVNEANMMIQRAENENIKIEMLDLDHDLGDFYYDGGDGIRLVLWLAETRRFYPIKLHSMNSVGVENMRAIVRRYWE